MRASVARRQGAVLALAAAVVVMRLPFLHAPEGSDEGGYLAVAGQWHAGPSLYGHYWVDRPPLLIMIFQLASALGGLPALRVLGAIAAGVAVVGVAETCRVVAGRGAAVVGAAVAAALFVSPQLGTVQVNGELLAAPFVAWSIALTLHALRAVAAARVARAAFGAGALAVAALLVKQNMAEPLIFATVAVLVGWRTGALDRTGVRRLAAAAAAGVAATLLVVGTWTVLHGTSLAGVFDAMYPFRLRAAAVLATLPDAGQVERSHVFLRAALGSGVLLLVVALGWAAVRRKGGSPAGTTAPAPWVPTVWALAATLLWATVSIVLSGGFWDHYLVELVVPVSMAGGLALGLAPGRAGSPRRVVLPGLAASVVVVVALAHWVGGFGTQMSLRGVPVGSAIAAVATPGDTVLSAVGDAETVHASGLSSPYPYLWTLPIQVDDPQLSRLTRLLDGPDAPTWLVPWDRPSFTAAAQARLDAVVARHYRAVGEVCGHPVLLHEGVDRPAPPRRTCARPLARW